MTWAQLPAAGGLEVEVIDVVGGLRAHDALHGLDLVLAEQALVTYHNVLGDDLGMAVIPTFNPDGNDYQLLSFYGSKCPAALWTFGSCLYQAFRVGPPTRMRKPWLSQL